MTAAPAAAANPASSIAWAIATQLCAEGVRHVVLCPGSRSQALALAVATLEQEDRIRLHVRVDERSAAFLALGLARASDEPTVVITTSGSAAANLWPAVIEAHHDGVPVIAITADRPAELQGVGANQTTRQEGIFGFAAATFALPAAMPSSLGTAVATARAVTAQVVAVAREGDETRGGPGPVHLNVAFREPLSGMPTRTARELPLSATVAASGSSAAGGVPDAVSFGAPAPDVPTVVVAGAGAGAGAAEFASQAGLPLIAEVVSGARRVPEAIVRYRTLLAGPLGLQVRRVVVFGRPTLSREVNALLARPDVDVLIVDRRASGDRFAPTPAARHLDHAPNLHRADPGWLNRWQHADSAATAAAEPGVDGTRGGALVDAVWRASGPGDAVYFASSRLVRVADDVLPPRTGVRVYANRGLAGIDGQVSTALGVAAVGTGLTRAVLGDLAFAHDIGGLLIGEDEARPPLQLVVGNDHGGGIFRTLEVASADPVQFRRVIETPQRLEFAALAAGYDWDYRLADSPAALEAALAQRTAMIIEVPLGDR